MNANQKSNDRSMSVEAKAIVKDLNAALRTLAPHIAAYNKAVKALSKRADKLETRYDRVEWISHNLENAMDELDEYLESASDRVIDKLDCF
jgi:prefoldin subunit 5